MGPRTGLDCGKSRLHRDSIPDLPACSSVAIPTELKSSIYNIEIHGMTVSKMLYKSLTQAGW